MDIICKICGEPWDSYGVRHGDMSGSERRQFLNGEGCPCCKGVKPKEDIEDHSEAHLISKINSTDEDPLIFL